MSKAESSPLGQDSALKKLLNDKAYLAIPNEGDIVKGKVISVAKREIKIDINGFTGIVRGRELSEEPTLAMLKPGEEIEATVLELENENGEMELSLRSAGQRKAWDLIKEAKEKRETIAATITEANKGGLIASFEGAVGFIPVSQLSPENYPRVSGGDKAKILEKLKGFVGQKMKVKILDADEGDGKLIFSEKIVWEEEQKSVIEKYKVGDMVEGVISALADFGAFVKFDDLEGLIHISEIAWQRIDHPGDLLKVGETIKAQIVGIEGSKIFLSMKKLKEDPWKQIAEKYQIGQIVEGTVLKANPFGFFVELDHDIHGLAHVSELGLEGGKRPEDIAKSGDKMNFKIITIEPEYHRLGLSLKQMKEEAGDEKMEKPKKEKKSKKEKAEETEEAATEVKEEAAEEKVEEVKEEVVKETKE
jgi:ribosomal protein S1